MSQESDASAHRVRPLHGAARFAASCLSDGVPIELGGRAFDVLMALIEAGGAVLSKDELMSRVWPGRVVEENNLQVQIAALRKALAGDRDLVRTVAGRGYQFTGEIRAGRASASPTGALAGDEPAEPRFPN